MENTLENKSKFFAQYYGQIVQVDSELDGKYPLTISNISFEPEKCHLELKPLSMISDEDLLKISELLSWRKSMQESSIMAQTKELLLSQSQTNLYREHWSDIVDKVRELGYAHKWNGITVSKQIEYGWIKLKENG